MALSTLDIPRKSARWVLSKHFHGNTSFELPIKYDIQENHIRLDAFILGLFYYITATLRIDRIYS
jgi:hypothetical protein